MDRSWENFSTVQWWQCNILTRRYLNQLQMVIYQNCQDPDNPKTGLVMDISADFTYSGSIYEIYNVKIFSHDSNLTYERNSWATDLWFILMTTFISYSNYDFIANIQIYRNSFQFLCNKVKVVTYIHRSEHIFLSYYHLARQQKVQLGHSPEVGPVTPHFGNPKTRRLN